jgi:hypothetical protein
MKRLLLNRAYIILGLILFQWSCSNDDDQPTPPSFQPTEIEFLKIIQGQGSGGGNIPESYLAINDETVWQALLDSTGLEAIIPEPEVDFNTHTVIAIILEVKPTGWFVDIQSIIEYEDRVEVRFTDTQDVTQAVSQPYHIVKIPATEGNFVFEHVE